MVVLFCWNLSRLSFDSFLGHVVDLDLLLCRSAFKLEHADLFLCLTFTQRQMKNMIIEKGNELFFGL